MRDIEPYTTVLGICPPWKVSGAKLDVAEQTVQVVVVHQGPANCPICGEPAAKYDTRPRRWRHLDLFQYRAFIVAEVPRINS